MLLGFLIGLSLSGNGSNIINKYTTTINEVKIQYEDIADCSISVESDNGILIANKYIFYTPHYVKLQSAQVKAPYEMYKELSNYDIKIRTSKDKKNKDENIEKYNRHYENIKKYEQGNISMTKTLIFQKDTLHYVKCSQTKIEPRDKNIKNIK